MNKGNIKTIQIAFNLDDAYQAKLYNYIKQFKNTSFYGKSLIQKDMNGTWKQTSTNEQEEQPAIELNDDLFKNYI